MHEWIWAKTTNHWYSWLDSGKVYPIEIEYATLQWGFHNMFECLISVLHFYSISVIHFGKCSKTKRAPPLIASTNWFSRLIYFANFHILTTYPWNTMARVLFNLICAALYYDSTSFMVYWPKHQNAHISSKHGKANINRIQFHGVFIHTKI